MSYVSGISSLIAAGFLTNAKVLAGEADCKDIDIKGKYIIINTDHKDFKEKILNTLFNAGAIRSICDYVIISDQIILVCELKSNNIGQMKVQLKNTGRIIKYILAMVKHHHKINSEIPPIKYVCFANIYKSNKQTSKIGRLDRITFNESELFMLSCNSKYHLSQFN